MLSEDQRKFLNSVLSSFEGEPEFELEDEVIRSSDPKFISDNIQGMKQRTIVNDQLLCVISKVHTTDSHYQSKCVVTPAFTIASADESYLVYPLEEPLPIDSFLAKELCKRFGITSKTSVPLPGHIGYDLKVSDFETCYTPEQLLSHGSKCGSSDGYAPKNYADAKILTPYKESDYNKEMTITLGSRRESKDWRPQTLPIGALLAQLCKHKTGKKDGPSVVLADMHPGQRLKNAVKSITGIGLDIDVGTPGKKIDEALIKLGCAAVRYTTFSNGKKSSAFKKDKILKHYSDVDEVTSEVMQDFCRDVEHWDEALIDSIEITGECHNERGIMVEITHDPMSKHRVIVPLNSPFEIAKQGKTQVEAMTKWSRIPEALANLLGVPFDKSCTDPSRLFYLPRHDENKPFEISLFGGPLFDWRSLQLEGAFDEIVAEISKGKGKSKTAEGKALGRWSIKRGAGFQIADVLEEYCEDRLRGPASSGFNIQCPFDEDHSNAGDQDDRACFAINAGDSSVDYFVVSCRHESCREYSGLDHLGKMVRDQWFPESVLTDEAFNIVLIEGEEEEEETDKNKDDSKDEQREKEDRAREEYVIALESLNKGSTAEQREDVIRKVLEAKLDRIAFGAALRLMGKKCGADLGVIKSSFKDMKEKIDKEAGVVKTSRDKKGRRIFCYESSVPDFHDAVDACIESLCAENVVKTTHAGAPVDFYPTWSHMDGTPVQLVRDPKTDHMKYKEFNKSELWSALCERNVFVQKREQGTGPAEQVPENVAAHVYNQFYTVFGEAPEIVYTPLFVQGGVLIQKPGYYGGTEYPGLNLILDENALDIGEIDQNPTSDQAEAAAEWIRDELLSGFPFLDQYEDGTERRDASEANALAMIMTPFMRRMITSCTPLFFITKPMAGTGGTLLGRLSMLLFDGFADAPARYSSNEEEMSKILVTEMMQAKSHLFFDDVKDFNNREILRALTSPRIGGRILGGSTSITRDNSFNWMASGNNPVILNEMERRIVWIYLNAKKANIQTRKFKHDLESFLLGTPTTEENRSMAVRAILTLIQYWISVGMPLFKERERKSFEDWSQKVGGVLQAVAITGFLDNKRSEGQDMDDAAIKSFVRAWIIKNGVDHLVTPAEAFKWATEAGLDIIEGINEDQKKSRFMRRLPTIEGRTFSIDGFDYMMRSGHDREQNAAFFVSQNGPTEMAT